MTHLLDTNIVSELRKGVRADANFASWRRGLDQEEFFISALVIGEIVKGVEKARSRDATLAQSLESWLAEVERLFEDRILDVDDGVAEEWGRLSAKRSVPVVDCLMAATARVHGLVLVKDVVGLGVTILNPFEALSPPH